MIRSKLVIFSAFTAALSAASCTARNEPTGASNTALLADFAGGWRSTTSPYEFIRLSVVSKSSEQGVLAAQLSFSGVQWDGSGHIAGDSLVMPMTFTGTTQSTGTVVARKGDNGMLRLQIRPAAAPATDLTLTRDN
ncbi:MAG: hypothetical protein ABJB66_16460 [Gemmatimonadaceae bacterium]